MYSVAQAPGRAHTARLDLVGRPHRVHARVGSGWRGGFGWRTRLGALRSDPRRLLECRRSYSASHLPTRAHTSNSDVVGLPHSEHE